jgi:uncharacterized membrane protein
MQNFELIYLGLSIFFLYLSIYYAIHNASAQNLSKINVMINPLVVESLTDGK